METSEDISTFGEHLDELAVSYKCVYDSLRKLKGDNVNKSLIQLGERSMASLNGQIERMKSVYDTFSIQINDITKYLMNEVESIERDNEKELERMKNSYEKMKEEMKMKNDEMKKTSLYDKKEPSFIYRGDQKKSKIDVELVKNYPGSYMYREYMSRRRNTDGDVYFDCDGENDELIVKYMKDDDSFIEDFKKMDNKKREKLLDDLIFLELPIKKNIKQIGCNEDNEMIEAWRNRRILINNEYNEDFIDLLKNNQSLDTALNNQSLRNIQYIEDQKSFTIDITLKFYGVIADYLRNDKKINQELIKANNDYGDDDELMNEMKMVGIELKEEEISAIRGCFAPRLFMNISNIIDKRKYDKYLQKWVGKHEWRLIYRASEHGYTADSFHRCCDDSGPTLVIIKSDNGCIFGGYTTQSWSGNGIYCNEKSLFSIENRNDSSAFIFTLKNNEHDVKPARFMKKQDNQDAICCNPNRGPVFGKDGDICIENKCNCENGGYSIFGNSNSSYECKDSNNCSLFVKTDEPDNTHYFKVLDYEVFAYKEKMYQKKRIMRL